MEKERRRKKLDQSLSGERFNEDDLIRSAAELYGRLSGFSRQSLAASQVARIVGNCFRNPAQMRSRSPTPPHRVAVNVPLAVCVCAKEQRREWSGGRAAPILMCESLGTITAITGTGRKSAHTIRVRGHFAVSHALAHSRFAQILRGFLSVRPTHLRDTWYRATILRSFKI